MTNLSQLIFLILLFFLRLFVGFDCRQIDTIVNREIKFFTFTHSLQQTISTENEIMNEKYPTTPE